MSDLREKVLDILDEYVSEDADTSDPHFMAYKRVAAVFDAAPNAAPQGTSAAEMALEHDRTKVAECVTAIKNELESYHWLIDSRGSYKWNDDRWHGEFKAAHKAISKALEPMVRIAADWSNCPKKWEDVQAARNAAPVEAGDRKGAAEEGKP